MPCPACIVALMGTDPPPATGMTTGAKVAIVGAGLLLLWLMYPIGTGEYKSNRKRRRRRR